MGGGRSGGRAPSEYGVYRANVVALSRGNWLRSPATYVRRRRRLPGRALEGEGYFVEEAHDARSALAAVQQKVPDLILQDLVLPDMNGLELVQRLRALAGSELPILALSGLLGRPEESRLAEAAFTALLLKPIEPSRLAETVRAYLPHRREPQAEAEEGPRLLIVDDDPVQLKLARVHFRLLGFDVSTATGVGEALTAARTWTPDVVLSDVFMPEVDGFQLCLEFRRDQRLAQVPIVLMSAQYGSQADQDLARRVGANALVVRTPDFAGALAALREAHQSGARGLAEEPGSELQLKHARRVIQQLERQVAATAGLSERCALQATQLTVLSSIARALTQHVDVDAALRDVLAVTLDAAGISKGALILRDKDGSLRLRQEVGFSEIERERLRRFFDHMSWLDHIVELATVVAIPSAAAPEEVSRAVLNGANIASAQVVPLISDGRGVGAMFIGATRTDVTSEDSIAFAQAVGNQVVQSLALTRLVSRLTASEQWYRTLLESAHDAIAILTPQGIIRQLNRRWTTIIGAPHEPFIGRYIEELVPSAREPWSAVEGRRHTVDSERAWSADITRPDRSIVHVEFSDTPVDLEGERLILTIGRDVTQQRHLQRQLRLAQRLEAVGHLAGGIAHDFNNVLTAILGFCEMLLSDLDPAAHQRNDVLEIKKATERASALTAQLLAFSRQQVLQPKTIDVHALVTDITPKRESLGLTSTSTLRSLTAQPHSRNGGCTVNGWRSCMTSAARSSIREPRAIGPGDGRCSSIL